MFAVVDDRKNGPETGPWWDPVWGEGLGLSDVVSSSVGVPADLDSIPPGAELAGILECIDLETVSGHDRVTVMRAHQRLVSHYQSRLYADMTAISDAIPEATGVDDVELAWDAASSEIRAALHLTRRAADTELGVAETLRDRLPAVARLLREGLVDPRRARTILHATGHLSSDTARAVVDRIIEVAPRLTTGQLRARLRRLSIDADPDEAGDRYRAAVEDRKVVLEATDDTTAHLQGFDLPPDAAALAFRHIDAIARTLRTPDEERTIDQLRADVFVDLLCGGADVAANATVDITVELDTLTRLADHPGDLAGYGPIVADIARQVADVSRRRRWAVTDEGRPVATGVTRRRPTSADAREVRAARSTCVFPGCRMPSVDCDLDHTTPWAEGGPTAVDNLVPLCRHDHRLRHHAGWGYRSDDDDVTWTSPLGHTHTVGRPP